MIVNYIQAAPDVVLSEEQVAGFRERFAEAMRNGHGHMVISPAEIDCIVCSGPDLIHAEGCPLAPPDSSEAI